MTKLLLLKQLSIALALSTAFTVGFCYGVKAEEGLGQLPARQAEKSPLVIRHHRPLIDSSGNRMSDPRPAKWCGWWLRHQLGVTDRGGNLARWWAGYGSRANGPASGVIAVYPHHVGIVTGVPGPGRIILKSGNDGHAVRERERSSRGVIAWRWAGASYAVAQ